MMRVKKDLRASKFEVKEQELDLELNVGNTGYTWLLHNIWNKWNISLSLVKCYGTCIQHKASDGVSLRLCNLCLGIYTSGMV
jgi:hypothetical protein